MKYRLSYQSLLYIQLIRSILCANIKFHRTKLQPLIFDQSLERSQSLKNFLMKLGLENNIEWKLPTKHQNNNNEPKQPKGEPLRHSARQFITKIYKQKFVQFKQLEDTTYSLQRLEHEERLLQEKELQMQQQQQQQLKLKESQKQRQRQKQRKQINHSNKKSVSSKDNNININPNSMQIPPCSIDNDNRSQSQQQFVSNSLFSIQPNHTHNVTPVKFEFNASDNPSIQSQQPPPPQFHPLPINSTYHQIQPPINHIQSHPPQHHVLIHQTQPQSQPQSLPPPQLQQQPHSTTSTASSSTSTVSVPHQPITPSGSYGASHGPSHRVEQNRFDPTQQQRNANGSGNVNANVNKDSKTSDNNNGSNSNVYNIANPSQHAAMTEILWSTVHMLQQRLSVCEQKLGIMQQQQQSSQASTAPHIINNNNVSNVNNGPLIFLPPQPQPQAQPQQHSQTHPHNVNQTISTHPQAQNVSIHHIQNQQHSAITNNGNLNNDQNNNYQSQQIVQHHNHNSYDSQAQHHHHMIPQPVILSNINMNNNGHKHKDIQMVDSKPNLIHHA